MQLSITLIIIIITTLISIGGFTNQKIIDDLIFSPPLVNKRGQWYRFITCGLIHADFMHLLFNMWALYIFGGQVEGAFGVLFGSAGKWYYLFMYVSAFVVSILPTYLRHINDYYYRSLGASGAVSAVIFAGMMLSPAATLIIFPIPARIPGFIFAPLYLLMSAYLDRKGGGNINHSAHLWGALYGLLFIIVGSKLAGFDIIRNAVNQVTLYMQSKGWI